jgi:hypothetical protein
MEAFREWCNDWLKGLEAPSIEDEEWVKHLLELGLGILENYFKWAARYDEFDVLWVEREYLVDIPGMPGVKYSFRTDGLVVDRQGRIWLLEHKTAAQLPPIDEEAQQWLLMDDQVGSYLWALTQVPDVLDLDKPIEGVMYNSLLKTAPKPLRELVRGGYSVDKRQQTTFEIALEQLQGVYGKGKVPKRYSPFLVYLRDVKSGGPKGNHFIRRENVRRNANELRHLGEMLRYEVAEMISNPTINRSPGKFNCSYCPFVGPCLLKWENGDWQSVLRANYQKRKHETPEVVYPLAK